MKKILLLILVLNIFILPSYALAQVNPNRAGTTANTFRIGQPEGYGAKIDGSAENIVGVLTKNAITLLYSVSAIAVIAYFLWGAFDWITSGGDKEKINSARRKMTHALIGLALLSLSFVIIAVVGEIVGFSPLKDLQIRGLGDQTSPIVPNKP